jgi:hypothetical protein
MKGLTDDERAQLAHLATPGEPLDLKDDVETTALNDALYVQGRVTKHLEPDPDDPDGSDWMFWSISPLGLLALKLWPAIRER